MNILLLGGCGFLGRNLSEELKKKHNVYIVDCAENNAPNYYKLHIANVPLLIKIIQKNNIQMILHLVSSIIPSSNYEQFCNDNSNIYNPSVKLLDFCAANHIKFVYFSSGGAVYGNQKEIFNEHTKREPVSLYGLSKLNFENAINFFHYTNGLDYLIIRPSNPYGYGQNYYGQQGLIAVIIGKIFKNKTIQIWGDGSAVKDYIYIDDLVYYITKLMDNSNLWNQIYNIGSGVGTSVNDVLDAFRQNNIQLPKIEYIAGKSTDVKRMILDCTKIQTLFPYKCKTLPEGIKQFWDDANR